MFSASQTNVISLEQSTIEAEDCFDIDISKQGIDEKYNKPESVDFMNSIFDTVLKDQICFNIESEFASKFTRVRIKDSTRYDLPLKLKDKLQGNKGKCNSAAAISIQHEYDICTGKVINNHIGSIKRTDYQDAIESVDNIEKDDLIIRDLGYFKTKVFKTIVEKEAFFLSRLHAKIKVFDITDLEISFKKEYNKMQLKKQTRTEIQAKIGEADRFPTRLILEIVPPDVYEKRLKKNNKEAKKSGYKVSEEYKARARFNLMITNVSQEDLPTDKVYLMYKLRWQIELTFKNWKSDYGIDNVRSMSYNRFMCLMYAKLILILINNQLINLLEPIFYKKHKKLLSKTKCIKTLNIYFEKIRAVLFQRIKNIKEFMTDITMKLSKKHWLEKRKNRTNFIELFELFICKSS